ncbi:hypothetical protein SAMN05444920_12919 [Nonomuraea solani]|uniref:Uncharacterized protein n=1 Tax=Nonomuraea solani TaxID=1144553 RepID=A0A1H6EXT6_9ACTN|nr:hypothetical protein SAMN05444920_12919 [Nonomuraea solani]
MPPLDDQLIGLLQAQVEADEELPYQLFGARRPNLSSVYVRQDLSLWTPEADQPPGPLPNEPRADEPRPDALGADFHLVQTMNGRL